MTSRIRLVLAVCFVLSHSAAAQSGRITVVDPTGKEAKRTAHRLRISTQQLHGARAALEEATELARRSDASTERIGALGMLWPQYHRAAAVGKIELVLASLRTRAQGATDVSEYKRVTAAAQQLFTGLAELDADRALELVRGWPAGPGDAVAAEQARRDLETSFTRTRARQLAYRDPEQALALSDQGTATEGGRYTALARLAAERYRNGRRNEALQLADQALADFERIPSGTPAYDEYGFLQILAQIDSDRALAAFESIARRATSEGIGRQVTTLRVGSRIVSLTPGESRLVSTLQTLHGRPELTMRAIGAMPALKAKVDEVGGMDQILNPDPATGIEPVLMMGSVGPDGSSTEWPSAGKVWSELRAAAQRDPAEAERLLTDKTLDASMFVDLAQRASSTAPEFASLVLHKAGDGLRRVDPLEKRLTTARVLVGVARRLEGEVDPALWPEIFRWTAEFREEERIKRGEGAVQGSPSPSPWGMTRAEAYEAGLLAEYARADFDAALALVRRLPAPARLSSLIMIAQTMRQF